MCKQADGKCDSYEQLVHGGNVVCVGSRKYPRGWAMGLDFICHEEQAVRSLTGINPSPYTALKHLLRCWCGNSRGRVPKAPGRALASGVSRPSCAPPPHPRPTLSRPWMRGPSAEKLSQDFQVQEEDEDGPPSSGEDAGSRRPGAPSSRSPAQPNQGAGARSTAQSESGAGALAPAWTSPSSGGVPARTCPARPQVSRPRDNWKCHGIEDQHKNQRTHLGCHVVEIPLENNESNQCGETNQIPSLIVHKRLSTGVKCDEYNKSEKAIMDTSSLKKNSDMGEKDSRAIRPFLEPNQKLGHALQGYTGPHLGDLAKGKDFIKGSTLPTSRDYFPGAAARGSEVTGSRKQRHSGLGTVTHTPRAEEPALASSAQPHVPAGHAHITRLHALPTEARMRTHSPWVPANRLGSGALGPEAQSRTGAVHTYSHLKSGSLVIPRLQERSEEPAPPYPMATHFLGQPPKEPEPLGECRSKTDSPQRPRSCSPHATWPSIRFKPPHPRGSWEL
ncbi:hypothetical protein HPG69_005608 [Diceros bicornis minor]|uniref:Uncharacterized protein n=1 Tax=Diceros bicornis minor TaxID=77932 RepID=A0A7J7EJ20_DICBM|nr:hypothetical protein HPG69_005608 [Diceros bicornis minor]